MSSMEQEVFARSMSCRLTHRVADLEVDKTGPYSKVKLKVYCPPPNGSGDTHELEIRLYLVPGKAVQDHYIWAQCDCGFHVFVSEVALTTRWNASSIELSNGKYPRFTNPNLLPRVCKHVLYGLRFAIKATPEVGEIYANPQSVVLDNAVPDGKLKEIFSIFYIEGDRLKGRPGITKSQDGGLSVGEKRNRVPPHILSMIKREAR